MRKRVMCCTSKTLIYHKPDCRHVERMLPEHRMEMTWGELSKIHGCRPCKCCNNMKHQYDWEERTIAYYEREKGMQFKLDRESLYVKTDISCWKIAFVKKYDGMLLFHRNKADVPVDFEHPYKEHYHKQKDMPHANTISECLNYIFEHDKFREAEEIGKTITFSKKKYRKQAERRKWRNESRRIDYLFGQIEAENKNLKKLACW